MKLCLKNAACFVEAEALKKLESQTEAANLLLENGQEQETITSDGFICPPLSRMSSSQKYKLRLTSCANVAK